MGLPRTRGLSATGAMRRADAATVGKRRAVWRRVAEVLPTHAGLVAASVITAVPFLWMFSISLKYFRDIVSGSFLFSPTLVNYARLLASDSSFPALFGNSLVIGVASTLLCLALGSLGAYSLTRMGWNPWVSRAVLGWIVVVQTVPAITLVGPFYLIALKTGLYNTRTMLTLVYVLLNLPVVVWMMVAFYRGLPVELEEAALIDGCSRWQAFVRVVVPLGAPGMAASGVLAFVFAWKEFLLALTLTSTPASMTAPVGIASYVQDWTVNYGEMSAAATLATLPGLLVAALAQRYLVAGLTSGAVKG